MTTIRISKEVEFDAGHRVPNHESKCKHPHGHRYRVRATLEGDIVEDPTSPEHGMLTDFSFVKQILTSQVHDLFDHSFVIHQDDKELLDLLDGHGWRIVITTLVPTAENIARMAWDSIADCLDGRLRLVEIAVWETPTSVAYYEGRS